MNTDFIRILREEHVAIRNIFDEIDAASDLENKKILIQKLQEVLKPHLKKEDEELYPTLEKSSDEEVRRMAKIFALTMQEYAVNFSVIINKVLASTGEMPADLATSYEKIRDRVKDRITIEEVTIFPAYEKSIPESV